MFRFLRKRASFKHSYSYLSDIYQRQSHSRLELFYGGGASDYIYEAEA